MGYLASVLSVNLAFSLLVAGHQVVLGDASPHTRDPACTLEEHDGLTAPFHICSKSPSSLNATAVEENATAVEENTTIVEDKAITDTEGEDKPRSRPVPFPRNMTLSPLWMKPTCRTTASQNETFCVFTYAEFAEGRGISLLTTPDIAEHITDRFAPELTEGINDVSNPPFERREMPGKGVGLVAKQDIQRGHLVHAHTPLVLFNRGAERMEEGDRIALQQLAVDQLPKSSRELFMDLMGHDETLDRVDAIINTNAFQVELDDDIPELHNAILPETAVSISLCEITITKYFSYPAPKP